MCEGLFKVLPDDPQKLYQALYAKFYSPPYAKHFNKTEKNILFPAGKSETSSSEFDVTLCYKILEKCLLVGYTYNSNSFPQPTPHKYDPANLPSLQNVNYTAVMGMLKDMRNSIFHRAAPMSEQEFKPLWDFFIQLLQILGYNTTLIASLENGTLVPALEISKLKADITKLQQDVTTIDQRTQALPTQVTQIKTAFDSDLKVIEKKLADLEKNTTDSQNTGEAKVLQLKNDIADLGSKLGQISIAATDQSKDIVDLKSKDEDLEKQIHECKQNVAVLETSQNAKVEKIESSVDELKTKQEECKKRNEGFNNLIGVFKRNQSEKVEYLDKKVKGLKNKNEAAEQQQVQKIDKLESKIYTVGSKQGKKVEELSSTVTELKEENEHLKSTVYYVGKFMKHVKSKGTHIIF